MAPHKVHVGGINKEFVFVDRDQLRVKNAVRKLRRPADVNPQTPLPAAPATFDVSKGGTIQYPTIGNDQVGDCYYVAVLKAVMTALAYNRSPWIPDTQTVIARYLDVAGGDNGMDDEMVTTEWTGGLIGPNGPYRLINRMLVNPADTDGHALAGYLFGGNIWTASLSSSWINNIQPGMVWDDGRNVHPNPGLGHAMLQTGRDKGQRWVTQTWGLNPPVFVTQAGLMKCDPEVWVYWQEEWFNAEGVSPNGHTRAQLREWWIALGGADPGDGPNPGPGPGPGPAPGPAGTITGKLSVPSLTLPAFDVPVSLSMGQAQLLARMAGWTWQDLTALLLLIAQLIQNFQPPSQTTGQDGCKVAG